MLKIRRYVEAGKIVKRETALPDQNLTTEYRSFASL
jgi:hypothetical protein